MSGCCTAILDKNPDNAVVAFNAYIDGKLQNLKVDEDEDLYPKKRGWSCSREVMFEQNMQLQSYAVGCEMFLTLLPFIYYLT